MKPRTPRVKVLSHVEEPISVDTSIGFGACCDEARPQKQVFLEDDLYIEPLAGDAFSAGYMRYPNGDSTHLENLTALGNNSPTLRSIIELYIRLTLTGISSDNPKLQSFFDGEVNEAGDEVLDVLEAYLYDRELYGNGAIIVSRVNKGLVLRHSPTPRWRYADEQNFASDTLLESIQFEKSEWWNLSDDRNVVSYPINDPTSQTFAVTDRKYRAGSRFYNLPRHLSAAKWSKIEYRIAAYNNAKFDNELIPSGILSIKGANSKEEGEKIVKSIVDMQTGTAKNGKLFTVVSRGDAQPSQFVPLQMERDGEFRELMDLAGKSISRAMGCPLVLVSHSEGGQLGDVQQMRLAFSLVIEGYVKPMQKELKRVLRRCFKGSAYENMDFDFSLPSPLSLSTMLDPTNSLTEGEVREAFGYPAQKPTA